ncbi:MAG TPA: ParB/RepB/Spo0J family partition protein [Candidatus Limnocylindrales bacterium]
MTLKQERHTGLGRGLASLIPQRAQPTGITEIPIDRVQPNPRQPRQRFEPEDLEALAASIREHGILQPILVTETLDGYQLVAGERRLRAAQLAGLERVPAVIRQLADRDQLEVALVENLQRADLGAIETAHAYRSLVTEFELSHDEIARRVGRAKSTITNTLRLLDLDPAVQAALVDGRLSEGHARAIGGLPVEVQPAIARTVVEQQLSVRQAEELVRRVREPRSAAGNERTRTPRLDPDLERVEEELRRQLGTKVTLARSRKGGRIIIEFYSDEELGQLYDRLVGGSA